MSWHPGEFPGYNGNGQAVLAYTIGRMLGVHIDYYAQVDLGGIVHVVDAVDGVDVNVDHALCDARYDEYGFQGGYAIGAGRHHLNGFQALAYARIRKSVGESDFTRAARQQQVVVALKDQIVRGGFIDDPIGLIRALGDTVETNVPPSVVRTLAPLATEVASKDIYRVVVGHPLVRSGFDYRGSIQIPDFSKIAVLGASLFGPLGTPADRYVSRRHRRTRPRVRPSRRRSAIGAQADAEAQTHPEADHEADDEANSDSAARPTPTPEPTPTDGPDGSRLRPRPRPSSATPAPSRRAGLDPAASATLCAVLGAGPVSPAYRSREAGKEARSSVSARRREPNVPPSLAPSR